MSSTPGTARDDAKPVALITGRGTGIGRLIAYALARDGFTLAIARRSENHLAARAAELRGKGARVLEVPTDVRIPEQVDRLFDAVRSEYGRLDVLVNNA